MSKDSMSARRSRGLGMNTGNRAGKSTFRPRAIKKAMERKGRMLIKDLRLLEKYGVSLGLPCLVVDKILIKLKEIEND